MNSGTKAIRGAMASMEPGAGRANVSLSTCLWLLSVHSLAVRPCTPHAQSSGPPAEGCAVVCAQAMRPCIPQVQSSGPPAEGCAVVCAQAMRPCIPHAQPSGPPTEGCAVVCAQAVRPCILQSQSSGSPAEGCALMCAMQWCGAVVWCNGVVLIRHWNTIQDLNVSVTQRSVVGMFDCLESLAE
eukprot:1157520-Pelagomonas_calceolata.AAC.3